ncbi:NAD(P)H-dependent flavin oxidoreductase [Sphingobium sp. HWE2-09]|uniref:NAD(P)H-dependent flavin oxidoreductase n=1 Tax=Sphingobium sp. HWE2-09 TaxID=3108390 RepID=UPI002DCE2C63|nr:nitronate monooxygenase [Sphingobium sp. HWE2-09]
MSLAPDIRAGLRLPVICAPMFTVTGPEMVREACLAGVIGGLPRHNARSVEEFESWLRLIRDAIDRRHDETPDAKIGAIAVNLASNLSPAEFDENLALCQRYGVKIIINATGNPTELIRRAHDKGFLVFADAVNLRFAEKAIALGVEGINAIGAGGGGHSGTVSHLAFVAAVRARFSGTIAMGGAISSGAAIRAAEILGADLAFLGTRFIATQESRAPEGYKQMIVNSHIGDLSYTDQLGGAPANWLTASLDAAADKPEARAWRDVWSAGQGIELIDDIPNVADLVDRLEAEYRAAANVPVFGAGG